MAASPKVGSPCLKTPALLRSDTEDPLAGGRVLRFSPEEMVVSVDSVARYFGGSGYKPDPKTRQGINSMLAEASSVIAPKAFYRLFRVTDSRADGVIILENGAQIPVPIPEKDPTAKFLVAGVCTLQYEFDVFYQHAARNGQIRIAMMANAIGVALLETISLRCLELFREEARTMGLFAGCFFGPGYGNYPLEGQKQLFDLICPSAVGVRLLPSMAMEPFKSLSFFLLYGENQKRQNHLTKCGRCHLQHCRFRQTMANPTQNGRQ